MSWKREEAWSVANRISLLIQCLRPSSEVLSRFPSAAIVVVAAIPPELPQEEVPWVSFAPTIVGEGIDVLEEEVRLMERHARFHCLNESKQRGC